MCGREVVVVGAPFRRARRRQQSIRHVISCPKMKRGAWFSHTAGGFRAGNVKSGIPFLPVGLGMGVRFFGPYMQFSARIHFCQPIPIGNRRMADQLQSSRRMCGRKFPDSAPLWHLPDPPLQRSVIAYTPPTRLRGKNTPLTAIT